MARKDIYQITVLTWEQHNKNHKKYYKYIKLSTRFLEDAKIRTLPSGGKLLYLGLLLACGDVSSSFIEASHDLLVTLAGGSGQVVQRLLDQLQSLQLVRWHKINTLKENREENRKEENRKEEEIGDLKKKPPSGLEPDPPPAAPPPLMEIWNANCGVLPKVKVCSKNRLKVMRREWSKNPDPEYWKKIVTTLANTDWCNGKKPSKGHENWRADFEYMLRESTQIKVVEGTIGPKKQKREAFDFDTGQYVLKEMSS